MQGKGTKYLLGQVGGFPLRLSWLPRAYEVYKGDQKLPGDQQKIAIALGIGKNMAKSLRVWAIASGILSQDLTFKPLAKLLIGQDPYFEQTDSIALLHWLICSNVSHLTANAWLFNHFNVSQFTINQAVSSFRAFLLVSQQKYAAGTVRVDIETALRMYTSIQDRSSYDMDDKFFYPLGLFMVRRIDGKPMFSRTWETERPLISQRVLVYSVLQTLAARRTNRSPVSGLYEATQKQAAPGVVFGYTREGFFTTLDSLVRSDSKRFALTSLPGGDFDFQVKGVRGQQCRQGRVSCADAEYFGRSQ